MKKILSILSLISAISTILNILLTLLTTYQFLFISQIFNSYLPIQIGIAFTMFFWGMKFFFYEKGWRKIAYSLICLSMSIGAIIFITMYVK